MEANSNPDLELQDVEILRDANAIHNEVMESSAIFDMIKESVRQRTSDDMEQRQTMSGNGKPMDSDSELSESSNISFADPFDYDFKNYSRFKDRLQTHCARTYKPARKPGRLVKLQDLPQSKMDDNNGISSDDEGTLDTLKDIPLIEQIQQQMGKKKKKVAKKPVENPFSKASPSSSAKSSSAGSDDDDYLFKDITPKSDKRVLRKRVRQSEPYAFPDPDNHSPEATPTPLKLRKATATRTSRLKGTPRGRPAPRKASSATPTEPSVLELENIDDPEFCQPSTTKQGSKSRSRKTKQKTSADVVPSPLAENKDFTTQPSTRNQTPKSSRRTAKRKILEQSIDYSSSAENEDPDISLPSAKKQRTPAPKSAPTKSQPSVRGRGRGGRKPLKLRSEITE